MSWINDPAFAADQPFGPQTLPYGVVAEGVAVRVGERALALGPIASAFPADVRSLLTAPTLDPLLAAGRQAWTAVRSTLTELVTARTAPERAALVPIDTAVLPFTVGDYVDFYSSRDHAENVGRMFRPDAEALLPNWTHLPVGYHGRAGTVRVSGTGVRRPHGQRAGKDGPVFGPSVRLDVEAEIGFVCGGPVAGAVPTSAAAEHIFGVVTVNDWSARDIQAWEYAPLGPFLGKSFATSVGAWITPLDAFAAARVPVPGDLPRLPYLVDTEDWGLDIGIEITWNGTVVSRPRFRGMSYSCAQQLAHMTVNGATVRPGDLFASGTVSGPEKQQRGSFLELSWNGTEPVALADGTRTFLEDGDTVTITATAPGPDGSVVGLSEVTGTVLAAG